MSGNDYLIEKRLLSLDPTLHKRVKESLFVLQKLLTDYLNYFPEFTDHAETHSLAVIDYCNYLIRQENIYKLNADELYVLLMSCYLHDIGMGISYKDYVEFTPQIVEDIDINDLDIVPDTIRKYHNEYSACFIDKYAQLFDFPTEKHMFAIKQTVKGHRKTDLFDEKEFPSEITIEEGKTICLPYLAAIMRLADEVNVAEDRNTKLLFDPEKATTEKQRMENAKHEAIKKMTIYKDIIELEIKTDNQSVLDSVLNLADKLEKTFEYCTKVVSERTPYEITQKKVVLKMK